MQIPFHKPNIPKTLDEISSESLKSGWLTTGPQVKKFEKMLSKLVQSKYVVAVNSCTAGLHLAMAAKNFEKGDKFIVPTYTFVASVEIGEYLGMIPVLVDCDENFNIDIQQVKNLLKNDKKIKAIVPVHFAGMPVDMKSINELSQKFDIFVLEDAAHALETISNAGKVGNTNCATAFSFYANKNLTTGGEGGAVATNDKKLAEKIRKLSLHGMSRDGWKRFKTGSKWRYDVSELGYKYNITDLAASYGIWQFKYVNEWNLRREYLFKFYKNKFKNIEGIVCPNFTKNNEKHAYHLFIIKIIPDCWKINRDKIIILLNDLGIGTSVHYIPIHMHSYYKKKYGYISKDFPNAEEFSENVISLPLYPELSDTQINYVTQNIQELWEKFKL